MPALKGIFVADPCEFTARLGGETVTFVFDAAKMTLRRDRDMKRALENGDVDAMVDDLLDVLISWDVLDEAGQPVPLSTDILLDLSGKALTNLIEGMNQQPSSAEGEVSGERLSTSPPAASTASTSEPGNPQQPPQNGEVTSPSPAPSELLSGT